MPLWGIAKALSKSNLKSLSYQQYGIKRHADPVKIGSVPFFRVFGCLRESTFRFSQIDLPSSNATSS
jgi:hypothetical protein